MSAQNRAAYVNAYLRPSLRTGFDWYRAFSQDERDNRAVKDVTVATPVLYLRGDRDPGSLESYVNGLRENGLVNVHGRVIADCGHFSPDEQPELVADALRQFIDQH